MKSLANLILAFCVTTNFVFAKNIEMDQITIVADHLEQVSALSDSERFHKNEKTLKRLLKRFEKAIHQAKKENESLDITLQKHAARFDEIQNIKSKQIKAILENDKKVERLFAKASKHNPSLVKEEFVNSLKEEINPVKTKNLKQTLLAEIKSAGSYSNYLVIQQSKIKREWSSVAAQSKNPSLKRLPAGEGYTGPSDILLLLMIVAIFLGPGIMAGVLFSATVGLIVGGAGVLTFIALAIFDK